MTRSVHTAVLLHASQATDQECCGLLLCSHATVIDQAIATRNMAQNPNTHFQIDPAVQIAAERNARNGGPAIAGYYHSHPNGRATPSPTDLQEAQIDGRIWAIIADKQLRMWLAVGDKKTGSAKRFEAVQYRIA